jgi:hypothetical protein
MFIIIICKNQKNIGKNNGGPVMKVCFALQVDQGVESTVYNHFGSAPAVAVDTELQQTSTVNDRKKHR